MTFVQYTQSRFLLVLFVGIALAVPYSEFQRLSPVGTIEYFGSAVAISYDGNTIVTLGIDGVNGFLAFWVYRRPNSTVSFTEYFSGTVNTNAAFSGFPGGAPALCIDRTDAETIFIGLPGSGADANNNVSRVFVFTDNHIGGYDLDTFFPNHVNTLDDKSFPLRLTCADGTNVMVTSITTEGGIFPLEIHAKYTRVLGSFVFQNFFFGGNQSYVAPAMTDDGMWFYYHAGDDYIWAYNVQSGAFQQLEALVDATLGPLYNPFFGGLSSLTVAGNGNAYGYTNGLNGNNAARTTYVHTRVAAPVNPLVSPGTYDSGFSVLQPPFADVNRELLGASLCGTGLTIVTTTPGTSNGYGFIQTRQALNASWTFVDDLTSFNGSALFYYRWTPTTSSLFSADCSTLIVGSPGDPTLQRGTIYIYQQVAAVPPVAAPVALPVAAPVAPPVVAPVAPPVAAPVAPPVVAPVAPPVAAPVAPPVAAPLSSAPTSPSVPATPSAPPSPSAPGSPSTAPSAPNVAPEQTLETQLGLAIGIPLGLAALAVFILLICYCSPRRVQWYYDTSRDRDNYPL